MIGLYFDINHKAPNPGEWVVYSLWDAMGACQFVGCCKVHQLNGTIPDARSWQTFERTFQNTESIRVRVEGLFNRKNEGITYINQVWLRENPRPKMMQSFRGYNNMVGVECIETGEKFRNISQAADAHDIDRANLSRHLNNEGYYKKLKGRTYRKIATERNSNV